MHYVLQAKLLRVKLLLAVKDYSSVISEAGYILKEDENNLEALLLRGRAYYYLADHDVATKLVSQQFEVSYVEIPCDLSRIQFYVYVLKSSPGITKRVSVLIQSTVS